MSTASPACFIASSSKTCFSIKIIPIMAISDQPMPLGPECFRIVHISDLHFWHIPLNPLEWWGKRILGLSNLVLRRARKFHLAAAPLLVEEILKDHPDHLVVSGDISTTSLTAEFQAFRRAFSKWLECPEKVTLVAGNHDRYTRRVMREKVFETIFRDILYPNLDHTIRTLRPGLGLVTFDPCVPRPVSARGLVDPIQLANLRESIQLCDWRSIKTLLFVCHYPAEIPSRHSDHQKGHGLVGSEGILKVLGGVPVPIFWLHGHIHHPWRFSSRSIPSLTYLNPGSPLLARSHGVSLGRWVLNWDGQSLQAEWRSLPSAASSLEDTKE